MVDGWFKIDISISGTTEIIERYYLMNRRRDRTKAVFLVHNSETFLR
jgi:hypothetical protein